MWGPLIVRFRIEQILDASVPSYGAEVNNTLAYLPKSELDLKIRLAEALGVVPVFACRMLPKSWVCQLQRRGCFALILATSSTRHYFGTWWTTCPRSFSFRSTPPAPPERDDGAAREVARETGRELVN